LRKNIICVIQARTDSTRFPEKVLKKIERRTLLSHAIRRVLYSNLLNKGNIVIATTTKKEDERITEIADKEGVRSFKGSEGDVLDRYYKAAKKYNADIVVRITSDCPLIDYEIIDKVIDTFISHGDIDYCSNRLKPSYPEGLDTEVFSFRALERAWREAEKPYDREHVTPYIYRTRGFRVKDVSSMTNLSFLHLSVDYKKDLEFARGVYRYLYDRDNPFILNDVINLFIDRPGILKINQTKAAYSKFLEYIKKVKISKKGIRSE